MTDLKTAPTSSAPSTIPSSIAERRAMGISLPELAIRIKAEHAAIVGKNIVPKAIAFGELLTRTKGVVGFGFWGNWLDSKCELSERTAQRYMDLA
jgi:hypothetical protein